MILPSQDPQERSSRPASRETLDPGLSGVLIVDKPGGITSMEAVRRVKKGIPPVRIGHAGTLDPLATGVLPVCIGEATKLIDHMDLEWKRYRGVLLLGLETDSWDITGKELGRKHVPSFSRQILLQAFREMEGLQRQQPPTFSALKFRGRPLYAYARQGQPVQAPLRDVRIRSFELRAAKGESLEFDLVCSRGTYVRSVVQSLGTRLGCGACLVSLRRMQSGRFHIDDAYGLHQVEKCMKSGRIRELLLLPEDVLSHLEAFEVQGGSEQKALNGNPLAGEDLLPVALQADLALRPGKKIRIQIKGRVMGVGEVRRGPEGFHLQPLRLFRVR